MFKLVNKILESSRHGFNIDMSDIMDPADDADADDIDDAQTNHKMNDLVQHSLNLYQPKDSKYNADLLAAMTKVLDEQYACNPEAIAKAKKTHHIIIDFNEISVKNITDLGYLSSYFKTYLQDKCIISKNSISCRDQYANFYEYEWDISMWDVSHVINMSYMFEGLERFNCNVAGWDVRNVKWMNSMFSFCKKFNQDLDVWGPRLMHIENTANMFIGCTSYTYPLLKWRQNKRIDMSRIGIGNDGSDMYSQPVYKWEIPGYRSYNYSDSDFDYNN